MAVEVVVPVPPVDLSVGGAATSSGTEGAAERTGPRWLLPAMMTTGLGVLALCLVAGGTVGSTAVIGLPDAGAGTSWALPVASFVAETAAVLGFGAALLAGPLIPGMTSSPAANATRVRALSTAGRLSFLAAAATLMVFVLTLSDLTARPLPQAIDLDAAVQLATFGPGRLLLIGMTLAVLGGVAAVWTRSRLRRPAVLGGAALIPIIVLAAALVPWALGGHTTQSGQDIAASSMIVHVLAAGAWVGGLAVIVMHVRGDQLIAVLPRFSVLALWCWVAIGTSGVITGWLRITTIADLLSSSYGRLLLVKLVLLGVLGGFGAWHRRRLSAGLRRQTIGERRALLRVAAVEVLVMGATMGVATALSGTAPSAPHAAGHDLVHGTSRIEGMVGHKLPVISTQNLLLLWRPDVIVVLLTAVLLAAYLVGVRRLRATGRVWPAGRVWSAVAAAVTALLVLNSGIASYDTAVWSVTVTQQAISSMLIPLMIVLARPWELIGTEISVRLAARGARPWWVLGVSIGWSTAVLCSPLALWSVTNHAVLMVARIGDIVVGTVLFALVLTPARGTPRGAARVGGRYALLFGWFAAEAGLAGLLLMGAGAAARPWFTELNIAWITVAQDEQTAAMLVLGVAIVTFVLAAIAPGGAARSPDTPNSAAQRPARVGAP